MKNRINNNSGLAAISMALIASVLALILVTSIHNQVQSFTISLIRARALAEAQFAVELLSDKIREAYIGASVKPHGVPAPPPTIPPSIPPIPNATYKRPTGPTDPNFHLVRPLGAAADIYMYYVGDRICFKRPVNASFGDTAAQICVEIPADFLAVRRDDELTLKDYFVFFTHKLNELFVIPTAIAQNNLSDPGTAGLSSAAVRYNIARNFSDTNFRRDYVDYRCDSTTDRYDCFRFRFCLRRNRADCEAGSGNERFVVQTIVLTKPPSTMMGE